MSLLTNLSSYWKLDEASGNAIDAHGSNNLTDNNTVAVGTGIISGARDFELTNSEFFEVVDDVTLSGGDVDMTGQVWVKLESKATTMGIMSKWGASNNDREYILFYDSGTDRFVLGIDGNNFHSVTANNFGAPSTGVWYLIHWWHDSVNDLIGIAVNAGTADTQAHATGMFDGADPFRLGQNTGVNFFDGLMDEAAFWKRVLTATERTILYNGGAGLAYPFGITFDAVSNSGYQTAASSYAWSHTITAATFLSVDVSLLAAGTTVTSVTCAGFPLFLIGAKSSTTPLVRIECWGLINPPPGSKAITVTLSGAIDSVSTAVTYGSTHAATPVESFNSAEATNVGAADATVTITPITDLCWVHAAVATDDVDVTASLTGRNEVNGASGSGANEDTGPVSPPAGTAAAYSSVGALATWAIAGYALRPAAAAPIPADLGWLIQTEYVFEYR